MRSHGFKLKGPGLASRKPFRHQLEGLDPFYSTQLAVSLLPVADQATRKWLPRDLRYLERILQTLAHHPGAVRTVLPALTNQHCNFEQMYRSLLIDKVNLDWEGEVLTPIRAQFNNALTGMKGVANCLVALNKTTSLDHIHQFAQLCSRPDHAIGFEVKESVVALEIEELIQQLISCGVVHPMPNKDHKSYLELHPLLSQYIRHILSPSEVKRALSASSVILHNRSLALARLSGVTREETFDFVYGDWDVLMTCLYHCVSPDGISFGIARSFDLPWLYCTLMLQQRQEISDYSDPEEVITDLALSALQRILPDYWPTTNLAWLKYHEVYLYKAGLVLSESECLFAAQLLLWIVTHFFDLYPQMSRTMATALLQLLEHTKFDASGGQQGDMERFLKGTALLSLLELDYRNDFWVPAALDLIWFSLQDTALSMDPLNKFLLQTWEQDFRFRVNGFDRISSALLDDYGNVMTANTNVPSLQ